MNLKSSIFLLTLGVLTTSAFAAEESEVETRLREGLRNTMLQLRDAQGQIATLQSEKAIDEQKLKEAQTKIDVLTKQAIDDRNTSTNMIAELNAKLEEQGALIVGYEAAVAKWKKSYDEVSKLAQKKEFERARLDAQRIKLDRQVEDQKNRNIQMYKVGLEILDRYEKFGLGDAILAREPFVGTTRVKFQNLIQNDQDKLTDSRIQP